MRRRKWTVQVLDAVAQIVLDVVLETADEVRDALVDDAGVHGDVVDAVAVVHVVGVGGGGGAGGGREEKGECEDEQEPGSGAQTRRPRRLGRRHSDVDRGNANRVRIRVSGDEEKGFDGGIWGIFFC